MLINRRDLEYILKVMDKFKLDEPYMGVDIEYNGNEIGYELNVSFGTVMEGIICRVDIPIVADMFDGE